MTTANIAIFLIILVQLATRVVMQDDDQEEDDLNYDEDDEDEDSVSREYDDEDYREGNQYAIDGYYFSPEEPNTTPQYVNELDKWSYAYEGGEFAARRPVDDKALVWAFGIRGYENRLTSVEDIHYQYVTVSTRLHKTNNQCMGVMVHPSFILTLCACVHSFYRSYKGLESPEYYHFKISRGRDYLVDISAPELEAYRTSWSGFENKTGQFEVLPISKHILQNERCTKAVDSADPVEIAKQYVAPVLLWVKGTSHPADPNKPSYFNFTRQRITNDSDPPYPYVHYYKRNAFPLEMIALYQKSCDFLEKNHKVELPAVPDREHYSVDFSRQLMITRWSENSNLPHGGRRIKGWKEYLFGCPFTLNDQYEWIKNKQENASEYQNASRKGIEDCLIKPFAGCFEWSWGNLCGALPGSPIFYYDRASRTDKLLALSITSVPVTTKTTDRKVIGMFLTEFGLGPFIRKEIEKYDAVLKQKEADATSTRNPVAIEEKEKILLGLRGRLDPGIIDDIISVLKKKYIPKSNEPRQHPEPALLLLFSFVVVIWTAISLMR